MENGRAVNLSRAAARPHQESIQPRSADRPVDRPRPSRLHRAARANRTVLAPRRPQANERGSRMDGQSSPPDGPFSLLRRELEKRFPRESGLGVPWRGARPPGAGETPSQSGSRGTRSARGCPGRRPAPRADDSTARRTGDHGRGRVRPWQCTLLPRPSQFDPIPDPRTTPPRTFVCSSPSITVTLEIFRQEAFRSI
jgi:hypothetical protein